MTDPPVGFESLLVSALDSSESVALYVLDDDLRYVWLSETALALRRRPTAEAIGRTLGEMLGDDFVTDELTDVLRIGLDRPVSEVVVLGDGRDRNIVAFPITVDGRRCVGSVAMRPLPSTLRTLALHRHRETLVTDAAEVGVWMWNRATGEAWWNHWVDVAIDHDPSAPRSLAAWERRTHPDDEGIVAEALQMALETGSRFEATYRVLRPNEEVRVVRSQGQLSPDDPELFVGVLLDVTESARAAEREAELQRQALEAIDLERDRLAADIHNGPLQGLSAAWLRLTTLAARLDDRSSSSSPTERVELADLARAVAESIARTNQELRDVLGHLRSLPVDASTDMFVAQIGDLVDELTEDTAHEVQTSFDFGGQARLPDSVLSAVFRIVAEAMINAAKHSRAASIQASVRLAGQVLEASVTDDGIGFDTTAPAPSGHFGLSVMAQRAASLHGRLQIRSTMGSGTTVQVTIPVLADD